jgi:hypothetical protein
MQDRCEIPLDKQKQLPYTSVTKKKVFINYQSIQFAPSAIAVTQDVVHPGLRAVSYSFCVIFQNLLGYSLGPIFVGAMSDRYNIETTLIILPSFTLLASFLYIVASRFHVMDLEKVEKITLTLAD